MCINGHIPIVLHQPDHGFTEKDSTEVESSDRAVESVKLPQEPFLMTENDCEKMFSCFTWFLSCLTASSVILPFTYSLPLYHLQKECFRPDIQC